jgi:hypothetical protein
MVLLVLRSLILRMVLTLVIVLAMSLIGGGASIGTPELALAAFVSAVITWWEVRRRRHARSD